ncbi:MobA/MobL family protein [Acinetobacter baumannii]|nr:MobA/MobL family protein [Acinetobacter baumannii]
MAIYHFSVKNISRADGRSAVAAAAYRSGEKLIDERQGKEQDYTKKTGVELKKIYAPEHTNPELLDRNQLWNTVEKVENRKNSQLAREFEIAFPQELNQEQRQKMLDELCQKIVERHGVVVDAAIHAPHTASGSDERNYHAHILLTTRSINERGELGNKTREFNDHGKQQVEHWREQFAELCNHHLEQVGSLQRVDHRSYKAQGLGLEATQHEGSKVTQLRRQGIDTEISLKNDAIKARNAEKLANEQLIKGLDQEISLAESKISKYQSEIRLEASKTPFRATETQKQVEQPKPQENRLERKSEPSSPIQEISTDDKKTVVQLFKKKIDFLAEKIHAQELEAIKNKMDEYVDLSKKIREKIENLRENKPFNPFKINAWTKELNDLINYHDNGIKAQYDNLKTDYQRIKNLGVTHEHWKKADAQMYQLDKNAYQKIKAFEIELNNSNANVSVTRSQDQDHSKGR